MFIVVIGIMLSFTFWAIENWTKIVAAGFTIPWLTIGAIWITILAITIYNYFFNNRNDDDK